MRPIAFPAFAVLSLGLSAAPAFAQGWKEYTYTEGGFAAQYPGQPKVEEDTYKTAQAPGGSVKERVYSFNSGGVVYAVAIADFRAANADEEKTINEAVDATLAQGKKTHDENGRLDWHFGREIRVEDDKGTSHTNAIFFIEKRLYQIRVDYPVANSDPAGSSGIHFFQQAFRLLP